MVFMLTCMMTVLTYKCYTESINTDESVFSSLDNKLREVERQLSELRRMRDKIDELETLRMENEKLQRDIKE